MEQNSNLSMGAGNSAALINGVLYLANNEIKRLYKGFLILLEDSRERGEIDDNFYIYHRKRILDMGNESIRQLEEQINNYINIQTIKAGAEQK